MKSIRDLMAADHRRCDDYFAAIERAVAGREWDKAVSEFSCFREAMFQHLEVEESILFPAFEARTGMRMGPTQVMRDEHAQMRELIEAAGVALAAKDVDEYSGNAETLLIMTQQHNMKEENILYPMCDTHLFAQLEELMPQLECGLGKTERKE